MAFLFPRSPFSHEKAIVFGYYTFGTLYFFVSAEKVLRRCRCCWCFCCAIVCSPTARVYHFPSFFAKQYEWHSISLIDWSFAVLLLMVANGTKNSVRFISSFCSVYS